MTERLSLALDRLERAVVRAENAVDGIAAARSAADGPGLAERHERLKQETRDAIAAIDRILQGDA